MRTASCKPPVHFNFLQTAEHTHAMIDMGHVIAGLQFAQGTQGNGLAFIISLFDFILVITLKDFMIRITDDFQVLIDKSFMNRTGYRVKPDGRLQVFKNRMQSFELFWIFCKEIDFKFFRLPSFRDPRSAFQSAG